MNNGSTFIFDPITRYTPRLYIAPNTLIPGKLYYLQLSVIVNNNNNEKGIKIISIIFFKDFLVYSNIITIQASKDVPVKAIISQGNELNITIGNNLTLDASQSFDPNGNTNLTFYWTCINQTISTFFIYYSFNELIFFVDNENCSFNILNQSIITILSTYFKIEEKYLFTVNVSNGFQYSTTSIEVKIVNYNSLTILFSVNY